MKRVVAAAVVLTVLAVLARAMLAPTAVVVAGPSSQAPPTTPTPVPPPTPIPYLPELEDVSYRGETSPEARARQQCEHALGGDRTQTAWRVLNCHVSRVTQGIWFVSGGLLVLTFLWAGIVLMMESTNEKLRGQSKVMIFGALTGFAIASMAYVLAEIFEGLLRPFIA